MILANGLPRWALLVGGVYFCLLAGRGGDDQYYTVDTYGAISEPTYDGSVKIYGSVKDDVVIKGGRTRYCRRKRQYAIARDRQHQTGPHSTPDGGR